ncbi:MAG: EamA family transporter [Deinococcota bacterium]
MTTSTSELAPAANNKARATLIGSSAIVMWGALALLTELAGPVPPFQLTAMSFGIAFGLGSLWRVRTPSPQQREPVPLRVWLFGTAGLFGYHAMYFVALANAPAVEASLIAYLWPLLIVLFAALLPGEKLAWFHVVGALLGFAGAVLLIVKDDISLLNSDYQLGYVAAFACALIWSGYSVGSRRLGNIPTESVTGFCAVTALLAALCHVLFETPYLPRGWQWLAVLGLGLGPVGAAFFTWDIGVKRGNIQLLGVLSYAAPLLSTLLLVMFGIAEPSARLGIACLLIVGGACVASLPQFRLALAVWHAKQ